MTGTIAENKELSALLESRGIKATPKDFLGGRVGIVNKKVQMRLWLSKNIFRLWLKICRLQMNMNKIFHLIKIQSKQW